MKISKPYRRRVKEEKRLVRLMYRTGLIDNFRFKLSELFWDATRSGKRYGQDGRRWTGYIPEIHYYTSDYYGEGDAYSLVDKLHQLLYWSEKEYDKVDLYKIHKPVINTRVQLIHFLKSLPTKRSDSKINRILRFDSSNI